MRVILEHVSMWVARSRGRLRAFGVILSLAVLLVTSGCAGLPSGATTTGSAGSGGPGPGATPSTGGDGGSSSNSSSPTTTVRYATTSVPSSSTTRRSTTTVTVKLNEGTEYTKIPGGRRVVALTFDAAYDPAPLADILAALEGAGVPATFFLTGEFVQDFPAEVQRIVQGGFPIGNHSYSHPDFTKLSDAKIRGQLEKTAALLTAAGAADPRPLFRFPYGARDKHTLAVVGDEGYASVYWTIDTTDWKPERTSRQIEKTVLDHLQPGAIVLMHVGAKNTAAVLPQLIREIEDRGYTLVQLREALP